MTTKLVDKFYGIVDMYYGGSDDFKEIEEALKHYEEIQKAVQEDSLASDGMEMIQAAMRECDCKDCSNNG